MLELYSAHFLYKTIFHHFKQKHTIKTNKAMKEKTHAVNVSK